MLRRLLLVLVLLTGVPASSHAQDGISQRQQEKILAKKAKEDKKAKAQKEKDDRKRHLSVQDKKTRKRIERNRRRAERGGPGPHRDGFFRRLFTR
ncbi:MAG: hypothetical protein IPL52_13040 [Flavobacteriales bacterium]|nr:hypothetical protein [Flavobacteriales bacterium]